MSNREARRQQSRQSRRSSTSYTSRRGSQGPSRGGGGGGGPSGFFNRPYVLLVAVLVIVLGAIVVFLAVRGDDAESEGLVESLAVARDDLPLDLQDGLKLGSDDAPIKMQQYEDFQCVFCLRYTADQEPGLVEEFVKDGTLQLEFKHFPILGTESVTSAVASTCAAEQNRFWEYHNELFVLQAEEDRFDDATLVGVASDLGLDLDAFETCRADPDTLALVDQHLVEGRAIGITGTPGFVINGRPLGSGSPTTMEGWQALFDQFLETPTPEGGEDASDTETPDAGEEEATATPAEADDAGNP